MIDLLKNDLPAHYGLHRTKITVLSETTSERTFDLDDKREGIIVAYKAGNVSFELTSETEVQVIDYESYLNEFRGTRFETGRSRCDFILYDMKNNGFFILNEQTSASGSASNLSKPILDKHKNVRFPDGKYGKAEKQLAVTLDTLKNVSTIDAFINTFTRKICLMSYVISQPEASDVSNARQAFTVRYKQTESRETGENRTLPKNRILKTKKILNTVESAISIHSYQTESHKI